MTYVSQENAAHDLLKVTAAMTSLINATDFSKPLPVEEAHGLYRASAQIEARADALKAVLGADYRDRVRTADKPLATVRENAGDPPADNITPIGINSPAA